MHAQNAPQKSVCPAATGQTQAEASKHSEILPDAPDDRKAFATLAARLALRGYALHDLNCGGFLVSRWDRQAHLTDIAAVKDFLRRVGGQP